MWNSTAFSEKRSESRSSRSMQKYQYFEWGSTLNLDGFKIIIFQYIICEPFRFWKEGLVKLDVNLWEIWRKFKCRRRMSYSPPPARMLVLNAKHPPSQFWLKRPFVWIRMLRFSWNFHKWILRPQEDTRQHKINTNWCKIRYLVPFVIFRTPTDPPHPIKFFFFFFFFFLTDCLSFGPISI